VNFAGVVAPLAGAVLATAWGLGPAMVTSGVVGVAGALLLPLVVLRGRRTRRWSLPRRSTSGGR
jgi:hypothetical protein